MAVKHWMQKAAESSKRKGTKGVFKAAAARHGMSTRAYAEKEKNAGGTLGKRANLALSYMNAKHGG
jgi:hypothetical protein